MVTRLPRATRLGPGQGIWHRIRVGDEKLKDLDAADNALVGV